jgi:succinate dehydrogenase / fumarate reductase iron-sulfur subunit
MEKLQKFMVYRNSGNGAIRYEKYDVPIKKGINILDALFYIQDYYDSTFSFRYACRGAVCGSCGMTIDKIPMLACRTQVSSVKNNTEINKIRNFILKKNISFEFGEISDWDINNEILIEPLVNMRVLKDLVVDMEPFWNFYRTVEPYFTNDWKNSDIKSYQSPNQIKSIERYVYCILCGLCWACPVNKKDPKFLGPAQLAKAYRFIMDTRISKKKQKLILSRIMTEDAVPACENYFICSQVCPKDVMPGTAIKKLRDF